MSKRKLIVFIFAFLSSIVGVISCTKDIEEEGISAITDYIGIVVEKSTMQPIEGVKVLITDHHNVYASDETDAQGAFEIKNVVTDELTSSYVLMIDGSPLGLPTIEEQLKGFGSRLYDYKTIPLYDRTQAHLNPIVSKTTVSDVTSSSASCSATVTKNTDGLDIADKGFVWGYEINPLLDTVGDNYVKLGAGVGEITHNITSLTPNRTYFVRAYATSAIGIIYGEQASFSTIDGLATVELETIDNVACNSITCSGSVINDGGYTVSERGVCWSTSQYPTVTDEHKAFGSGLGTFNGSLTTLTPSTTYYIRAYATNVNGTAYSEQQTFTTSDGLPVVLTRTVSDITSTSAVSGGNVASDGGVQVTERGLCWSTSQYPTINGSHVALGSGTGTFTGSLTNLSLATVYYVRAYATNANGTVYGEQKSFITTDGLPTVSTNTVSGITSTSAVCGGDVSSDGGVSVTSRGLCWSTTQYPTINGSHSTLGSGTGTFTGTLTSLSISTTYYVRAYATNANGTVYGEQRSFTTTTGLPTVSTNVVTDITASSAVCGGAISSDGGYAVSDKGLVWSTSTYPTIDDNSVSRGSGSSPFSATISGLAIGTTYYIRAYATNVNGTVYGEQRAFTTTNGLPTVSTTAPVRDNLTVVTGGTVSSDGGYPVTTRGICYSLVPNPDISASHTQIIDGSGGTGSFTSSFTLPGQGVYYIRAYATNSMGTAYGQQQTVKHPYNELPTFTYGGQTYRVAPAATNNMMWSAANEYCNNLDLYGYTDWRLPSKDELMAMSTLLNTGSRWWSGTLAISPSNYYYLYYYSSSWVAGSSNGGPYSVRPVRVEN